MLPTILIAYIDFGAFMGPVINASSFEKISKYIDLAKTSDQDITSIIAGGKCKTPFYFSYQSV